MFSMRKQHKTSFKAKTTHDALKVEKTLVKLAGEFDIHPNQIGRWKAVLLENLPEIFSGQWKCADNDWKEGRGKQMDYHMFRFPPCSSWRGVNVGIEQLVFIPHIQ